MNLRLNHLQLRTPIRLYLAPQQGSLLELGLLTAESCRPTRQALLEAVGRNESSGFVRALSRRMERSQPVLAADMTRASRTKKALVPEAPRARVEISRLFSSRERRRKGKITQA